MLSRADRKTLKIVAVGALIGFVGYQWWLWYKAERDAGTPRSVQEQDARLAKEAAIPEVILYER